MGVALAVPVFLVMALAGLAQPTRAAGMTVDNCDESTLDAAVGQANADNAR
jgi:hypothetical protein